MEYAWNITVLFFTSISRVGLFYVMIELHAPPTVPQGPAMFLAAIVQDIADRQVAMHPKQTSTPL